MNHKKKKITTQTIGSFTLLQIKHIGSLQNFNLKDIRTITSNCFVFFHSLQQATPMAITNQGALIFLFSLKRNNKDMVFTVNTSSPSNRTASV